MKNFRFIFLIIILTIIPLVGAMSQVRININDLTIPKSKTEQRTKSSLINSPFSDAERVRPFFSNRNLSSLNIRNRGDILLLDFFEDKRYQAIIEKATTDGLGLTSITAKISGTNDAYCYMTVSNKDISIVADIPEFDEEYFIGTANGDSYVSLYKRSSLMDREPACGFDEILENKNVSRDLTIRSTSPCVNTDLDANVTIDLMIVYTPASKLYATNTSNTTDINSLIATIVSKSNQVMANSKTGVTFRLVHKHEVNYVESDSYSTDLSRLRNTTDGYMDEIHALKKQYGADLVMLLGRIKGAAGVAYLPGSINGSPSTASFSVVDPGYGLTGYTAVHEMGHNFGCNHHRDQNSKGLFSYSTGWRGVNNKAKKVCTVMPYAGTGESRIPYFSSPNIEVDGVTLGSPDYEDNALTIRRMKCVTSKYTEAISETPPTVSIISPAKGAKVTTNSVEVVSTASAASGKKISKVEFYIDGILKSTKTAPPYTASVGTLSPGSNWITVVATDDMEQKGNVTFDVVYEPLAENLPPTVSISSPTNGSTITTNSVNVSANASDSDGSITKVEFYLNGVLKSSDTSAPYSASVATLNSGSNSIQVKAFDDKGATSSASVNVNYSPPTGGSNQCGHSTWASNKTYNAGDKVYYNGYIYEAAYWSQNSVPDKNYAVYGKPWKGTRVLCDNQPAANVPPTVSITSPANGTSVNATSVSVSANASDTDGSISKVEFFLNGVLNSTDTSAPYSSSVGTLKTGSNTILAKATDDKGATAESGITINYTAPVANVPPTVSITSPASGTSVNATSVSVSANASDTDGSISKVEFFLNGVLNSTDTSAPYSSSVGTLKAGSNTILAKATDDKGATAESDITINYTASVANVPPTVSITSPANGTTVNTGSVTVGVMASDTDGSISKVELYLNGILKSTLISLVHDVTLNALQSGSNTIMAKAFDDKGAFTTASISVNYIATSGDDCMGVEAWLSNRVYNSGDKVKENGVIYKADYWTQSNLPSLNHGSGKPWSVVSKCDGTIDAGAFGETQLCDGIKILVWKAESVYDKAGIKVVYQNKIYSSKYWTKGNIPSSSGAWSLIGPCK